MIIATDKYYYYYWCMSDCDFAVCSIEPRLSYDDLTVCNTRACSRFPHIASTRAPATEYINTNLSSWSPRSVESSRGRHCVSWSVFKPSRQPRHRIGITQPKNSCDHVATPWRGWLRSGLRVLSMVGEGGASDEWWWCDGDVLSFGEHFAMRAHGRCV